MKKTTEWNIYGLEKIATFFASTSANFVVKGVPDNTSYQTRADLAGIFSGPCASVKFDFTIQSTRLVTVALLQLGDLLLRLFELKRSLHFNIEQPTIFKYCRTFRLSSETSWTNCCSSLWIVCCNDLNWPQVGHSVSDWGHCMEWAFTTPVTRLKSWMYPCK